MNMNINPFSYLLYPFQIMEGYIDDFTNNTATWKSGVVTTEHLDDKYREGVIYPYFQDIFCAFVGNPTKESQLPLVVKSLIVRDGDENDKWVEKTLCLETSQKSVEFGVCTKNNSFDSIKLVIDNSSNIGLLIVPISIKSEIDELCEFLYKIRRSDDRCIWKKGEDRNNKWCLGSKIDSLLQDFKGKYVFFNQNIALHYSFIVSNSNEIDNKTENEIIALANGLKSSDLVVNDEKKTIKRIGNGQFVASSIEGTVVYTQWNKAFGGNGILDYRKIQTERYMIFIVVFMQRFSLLGLAQQIVSFDNRLEKLEKQKKRIDNEKVLNLLREVVGSFSHIQAKNRFTFISGLTEHNTFYQICFTSFGISDLYKEISEKATLLNSILTQKKDKKHEDVAWKLSIILAILTVTSAANDILEITEKIPGGNRPYIWFFGYLVLVAFVSMVFYKIIDIIRR